MYKKVKFEIFDFSWKKHADINSRSLLENNFIYFKELTKITKRMNKKISTIFRLNQSHSHSEGFLKQNNANFFSTKQTA